MVKLQPFQIDDGYTTFIDLTDTPNNYIGESGNVLVVSGTEDGLEFGSPGGGGLADGCLLLPEISDPLPLDDYGIVYAKEVTDGYTELYYLDNYGIPIPIVDRGAVKNSPNALWAYPENPHSIDDEFEDVTLGSNWAEYTQAIDPPNWAEYSSENNIDPYSKFDTSGTVKRAIHTEREKSWYLIQPPADSYSYFLTRQYTLPTNAFIWMRGRFSQRYDEGHSVGDSTIALSVSGSDDGYPDFSSLVSVSLNNSNQADKNVVAFVALIDGYPPPVLAEGYDTHLREQGYDYVGIHKVDSDYYGWVFNDAGQSMYLEGKSMSGVSFDRISISFQNADDGYNPGNAIMGVDFIRVFESATFLPGMHR